METLVWKNEVIESLIEENSLLENHSKTLIDIAAKDGGVYRSISPEILAIDVDAYKVQHCKGRGTIGKTVDAIVGCQDKGNKLLMVEFRLNYTTFKNLKSEELKEKCDGTKSLITSQTMPYHKEAWFVFREKNFNQYNNWFKRQQNAKAIPKTFVAKTPKELC